MARFEELRSMRERSGDETGYPRSLLGVPASGALPPSLNAPMSRGQQFAADVTLTPQSRIEEGFKGVGNAIREGTMDPQGQNASRLPEGYSFERPQRSQPLHPDIQVLDQMQHNQPGMASKADREALMALIEQYGFANPPR